MYVRHCTIHSFVSCFVYVGGGSVLVGLRRALLRIGVLLERTHIHFKATTTGFAPAARERPSLPHVLAVKVVTDKLRVQRTVTKDTTHDDDVGGPDNGPASGLRAGFDAEPCKATALLRGRCAR